MPAAALSVHGRHRLLRGHVRCERTGDLRVRVELFLGGRPVLGRVRLLQRNVHAEPLYQRELRALTNFVTAGDRTRTEWS